MDKAPDAFRTISEVASDLEVPQHVLRFWESRFREIKPMKRGGGRRYYRPDDVSLLRGIRHLLYGEGYTIRGVQRILKEHGVKFVQAVWQPGAPQPAHRTIDETDFATDDAESGRRGEDGDRGRGLFSLLPKLLADNDPPPPPKTPPELKEQSRSGPADRIVPPLSAPAGISREDFRRLQGALQELGECRDLLNAALAEAS